MAKHLSMWQICIGLAILGRATAVSLSHSQSVCGWKMKETRNIDESLINK